MAQGCAGKTRVLIGGILNPLQSALLSGLSKLGTGPVKQGAKQIARAKRSPLRHPGQAPQASAPQDSEQQSFQLIVLMVRQ